MAMKTVNSLSGGKTSSYIAANYPADYNIFSLVRTDDKNCLYPDKKVRQIVSDKIGKEFMGTLEDDIIIDTMLDLEQFIGKKIHWLSGNTFDDVIKSKGKNGVQYIPNPSMRFCTVEMKIKPLAQWCYENTDLPIEMRVGFRANETRRGKNMLDKCINGIEPFKFKIGTHPNGNNKWKEMPYRKPSFPLIDNGIYKDSIIEYWKDKPVRFAKFNNCVGCFHQDPLLLKHRSTENPTKFDWFIKQEEEGMKQYKNRLWNKIISYKDIKKHKSQIDMFDDDFNECDSGYCGL
jgi:hypothetical protein